MGVTIPRPEFERQCSSSRKGNRGNWGEWRVFGGISISANVLFSLHCPHILMVYYISQYMCWFPENVHAYSRADGVTRLTSHQIDTVSIEVEPDESAEGPHQQRRLYCHDPLRPQSRISSFIKI